MKNKENGSVSAIVVVTILFILMILGTYLTTISSKRKSQLQETALLQNVYDGDMKNIYQEQLQKRSNSISAYTDVMYIEASGMQKLSGITLPDNYKMSITASLEEGEDYSIFDSNLGNTSLGINSDKKLEFKTKQDVQSDENTISTVSEENNTKQCNITFGQKLTITNDCSGINNMVLIDGAKVIESDKTTGPSYITMLNGFKGKIYSISIYEDDELKYNLVPCYKNDTKKVGLYDTIGKRFYGNNASGTDFKAGPEI